MTLQPIEYLDIAHKLKTEADHLMEVTGLQAILQKYGRLVKFGSYALDLMVWPDLDLYIEANNWPFPKEQLAELCHDLAGLDNLLRLKVETQEFHEISFLPDGIYVGLKLNYGEWKLPWKFDIWILDHQQILEKQNWLEQTLNLLTPSKRAFILEQKHLIMTKKGRTPTFSSYHLYEAILKEGLHDPKEIRQYLLNKGILLPDIEKN